MRYILHPTVKVNAMRLAELYGLSKKSKGKWLSVAWAGYSPRRGDVHLHVRDDGQYVLPVAPVKSSVAIKKH